MSDQLPERFRSSSLAAETTLFHRHLEDLGLPTNNIIASDIERTNVNQNLRRFLMDIPPEEKRYARYLSKFVGATAIGLFDAALNYVWNEVVINLRKKAVIYGVDLFFDAAVGGKVRDSYQDESDLEGLKDSVLLDTCRKLELISDIVYRKLDHILTMRNEVAASHPNVESIGGYELLGWLQTCVKDVLQDKPSESAIQIKQLVSNLKTSKSLIDRPTVERFVVELKNLSQAHVNNLLITIFGIFVSDETDQILRKNIANIALFVWDYSEDKVKYHIGSKIDGFRANLDQRKEYGIEFLSIVNGKMYESISTRVINLNALADQLKQAHEGYDNYYNEPPIMHLILQYIKKSTDIPTEVLPNLSKAVMRCRIGRGLSYREGVSPTGLELYNHFLKLLDDRGISFCIACLFHPEINSKLENSICQKHLGEVLSILQDIAISERLKEVIAYLMKDLTKAYQASSRKEFRELSAPFIGWK